MSRKSRKQPSVKRLPAETGNPRTAPGADPARHAQKTVVQAVGIVDLDGPCGWRSEAVRVWWNELLPRLRHFETMTWEKIVAATGGPTRGNNHHFVAVDAFSGRPGHELSNSDIGQDDVSELFSLRLTSMTRVYGIRDRRAHKLLWYDRHREPNPNVVHPVQDR